LKITVVGTGYVGLSNAILLAQKNEVIALDIDQVKVDKINKGISPIDDKEISEYLQLKELNLQATTQPDEAFENSEIVIVSTPTNYDPATNYFNTESVESVIAEVINRKIKALIVIKSTVPVGFTEKMRSRFNSNDIIFSPEFLREGKALHDNLYPSRIIVGENSDRGRLFGELLQSGSRTKDAPVLLTDSTEAEAIKLFANT
jgi:UDPglucose 6-dehydrogenase